MSELESPLTATLRAAVRPVPLVFAGLAVAAGVLIDPLWAIPAGVVYVALICLLGPVRWRARKLAIELGMDLRDAPPGLRRWNSALYDTLRQIDHSLRQSHGPTTPLLRPIGDEVRALGEDIRRLIRRAYALHRYLQQTNAAVIAARIAQLEGQIANTADAYSRQQLTEAVAALRRQVTNCEQMRVLLSRTEATLENMHASLQAIGSSVVKINASGGSEAQVVRDQSLDRLASARGTVSSLEEVLEAVELA